MIEKREYQLKVRLTNSEKEKVVEFAAAHNLTISDLVRQALNYIIGGNKNDK